MNTKPDHPPRAAPDPLAVTLSKLDPAPHGFDWNALMFAAGRASKARALLFWRVATGVCAVAACGFAFAFFTRPTSVVVREQTVYRDRAPAPVAENPIPAAPLDPAPRVKPELPSVADPSGWTFDAPPERGAAARWLTGRNEILTFGLGLLPDTGHKVPSPQEKR
ncbi:hypothetical protein [Frigoriglobus tundricola]|uniref:Uncharacterized protein n=1 Tax=Frigoriglobus tundricola TaxID=2774151 RepID=A0A6M5YS36_9BACT|nr:hypothetical protein [Frigoriglobus tundricola]QJW96250.1 hypothetical protein FTUN_3807 [Frigoriglobus tundricola]